MSHDKPNPFPLVLGSGNVLVDEKCQCGALRSEHEDTVSYGHGAGPGACAKFTWKGSVYESN